MHSNQHRLCPRLLVPRHFPDTRVERIPLNIPGHRWGHVWPLLQEQKHRCLDLETPTRMRRKQRGHHHRTTGYPLMPTLLCPTHMPKTWSIAHSWKVRSCALCLTEPSSEGGQEGLRLFEYTVGAKVGSRLSLPTVCSSYRMLRVSDLRANRNACYPKHR